MLQIVMSSQQDLYRTLVLTTDAQRITPNADFRETRRELQLHSLGERLGVQGADQILHFVIWCAFTFTGDKSDGEDVQSSSDRQREHTSAAPAKRSGAGQDPRLLQPLQSIPGSVLQS